MEEYRRSGEEGKAVFVGVDLHRVKWHVTVRTEDEELFSGTVCGGCWIGIGGAVFGLSMRRAILGFGFMIA
jgi:hypothetical protein